MSTREKHPRKATTNPDYGGTRKAKDKGEKREVGDEDDDSGYGEGSEDPRESAASAGESSPSPSKKRKASGSAAKGKGKAKKRYDRLIKLPREVFEEIASYLHPGELLKLARTSATYYRLFSRPSSIPLWRRGRKLIDLPDLEAEDMTEIRYARLIFDRDCAFCHRIYAFTGNPFQIRLNICTQCARENLVRLRRPHQAPSHLHPASATVVPATQGYFLPTAGYRWAGNCYYALRSHLNAASAELSKLDKQDIADAANGGTPRLDPGWWIDLSSSGARTLDDKREGPRLSKYIAEKSKRLKAINRDHVRIMQSPYNKALSELEQAHQQALRRMEEAKRQLKKASKSEKHKALLLEIFDRLRKEAKLFRSALGGEDWGEKALLEGVEELTDEAWTRIKPALLAAANRARLARSKQDQRQAQAQQLSELAQQRRADIGARYEQAFLSVSRDPLDALPLPTTFLALEAVEPLLLKPDHALLTSANPPGLTNEEWDAAWPLIKDELAEYRLNLTLHAYELILSSSSSSADSSSSDDNEGDALSVALANPQPQPDSAFLTRATSFLCCTLPGCGPFVGPLPSLLAHHHAFHSSSSASMKLALAASEPEVLVALPQAVGKAVRRVLELGELGEDAGMEEMDEVDGKGGYMWENGKLLESAFGGWRELLSAIAAAALSAARTGSVLPDPRISLLREY
ncbi:hypothetical protein JCM10207_003721 [Rhodosporidiobolus poonsookiae]